MSDFGYPTPITDLIELLKGLPGVGKRGAERMALAFWNWEADDLARIAEVMAKLKQAVTVCPRCGFLAENGDECVICRHPNRKENLICVVEEPEQIISIEKSGFFRGRYHVLGGKLSPLDERDAEQLRVSELMDRLQTEEIEEVILALSQDVEGKATAIYLSNMIKETGIEVTRLAQGLPAGADISYADAATIAAALNGRTSL